MLSKNQHLLLKLSEEATEISHILSKCIQFGLSEKKPDQDLTNADRLYGEINDFLAVLDMLNDRHNGFEFPPEGSKMSDIEKKQAKVDKYLAYSQNLRMVER